MEYDRFQDFVPCGLDGFIPEITEVVLRPRESAPYVQIGNRFEGLRPRTRSMCPAFPGIDINDVPCDIDYRCNWQAIDYRRVPDSFEGQVLRHPDGQSWVRTNGDRVLAL